MKAKFEKLNDNLLRAKLASKKTSADEKAVINEILNERASGEVAEASAEVAEEKAAEKKDMQTTTAKEKKAAKNKADKAEAKAKKAKEKVELTEEEKAELQAIADKKKADAEALKAKKKAEKEAEKAAKAANKMLDIIIAERDAHNAENIGTMREALNKKLEEIKAALFDDKALGLADWRSCLVQYAQSGSDTPTQGMVIKQDFDLRSGDWFVFVKDVQTGKVGTKRCNAIEIVKDAQTLFEERIAEEKAAIEVASPVAEEKAEESAE